jgi:hypothetical protein
MRNFILPVREETEDWLYMFDRSKYPEEIKADLLEDVSSIIGYIPRQNLSHRKAILNNAAWDLAQRWANIGLIDYYNREKYCDGSINYVLKVRDIAESYGIIEGRVGVDFIPVQGRNLVMSILDLRNYVP